MTYEARTLNGSFGLLFDGLTCLDLNDKEFRRTAYRKWIEHHGLLILRGTNLAKLSPESLISISQNFGVIDEATPSARENCMVGNFPILRIGNIRTKLGEMISQSAVVPQLISKEDIQYNKHTKRPVWHTDSTFLSVPPIGSVLHCKQAPDNGAETLFANTRTGYASLCEKIKRRLKTLEAVCSLAHHDKKVNSYSPDYPTLTPKQ